MDQMFADIAKYVLTHTTSSEEALKNASLSLADAWDIDTLLTRDHANHGPLEMQQVEVFNWPGWLCEMGYPLGLTTKKWRLLDVLFGGKPLVLERPLGCYVMENILFKISFPAEFHAQTALSGLSGYIPSFKTALMSS